MKRVAPTSFDFRLEYLQLQPDLTQWAQTFDAARLDWRLDNCWQLLREARRWAETPEERAQVRFYEGLLHVHTGDWERAEVCYRTAQVDLPDTGVGLHFSLLGERGMLARLQGDGRTALSFHEQQYDLAQTYNETVWLAEALDQIAMDHELLNSWKPARRALQRALDLCAALEDLECVAGCHNRLGLIALREEQFATAAEHLEIARAFFVQLEQPFELAQVEGNLGNLAYLQGSWDQAAGHYRDALQSFDDMGVLFEKIGILNNLGSLAMVREDEARARQLYGEALQLARDLGDQREARDVLVNLGLSCMQSGDLDIANQHYIEALALTRELDDRGIARKIYRIRIRLWLLRCLHRIRSRLSFSSKVNDTDDR